MKRREWIARVIVLLIMIGLPVGIFSYQFIIQPRLSTHRIIDISAAVAESGGFQPDSINVQAGETVTLRFHSVDVTHSVAIGPGLGIDLGTIDPGHVKEVTLTFDKGGIYTFYCNSWCSTNHWRMRGVITVNDPAHSNPTPQHDPVIEALATQGVNIDDDPMLSGTASAADLLFTQRPSPQRGATLIGKMNVPPELRDLTWRHTHSPLQALQTLSTLNPATDPADLADVVAYLWVGNLSADALASSASLYAKNCAACHGENGNGKGPAAPQVIKAPVDFTELARITSRQSDVLYAKIRRGGMGTGMPNFGTVFTPEETWALVDYLWTFVFPSP